MDGKRRTSLLRKSVYARDENTAPSCTPRLKRRISFSGKHLVREFHREEEPKAWENSYEISDHLNADEIGSKLSMSLNKARKSSTIHQNQTNLASQFATLEYNLPKPHLTRNVLSTSMDLTNVTDQNNTLYIENSVNITLFESEKQYFAKYKGKQPFSDGDCAYNTNVNSFSLNENEMFALPTLNILGERTIDFMEDVRHGTYQLDNDANNTKHMSVNEKQKDENDDCIGATVYNIDMDQTDYMKSICDENRGGKKAVTIYMNDSLSTSSSELPDSKPNADYRKTMDFSPGNAMDFGKENVLPATSPQTINTSKTSCFMNIESGFDLPNLNPNIEKESKKFYEKLDRISLLKNYNDDTHMLLRQDNVNAKVKAAQRSTINFDELIQRSPAKPKPCHIRSSINTYDDMNLSPTQVNIPESARKIHQPTKLVVRKICTPFSSKSQNPHELDKQRIQRYRQKKQLDVLLDPDLISLSISPNSKPVGNYSVLENSLNFSLSNTKSITLSPETSCSLLIPSEYKSYNFKQLNDEFECGKIQLFSKTNTVDRKPAEFAQINKNTVPESFIQRKTLFFESDITSDHSSSKDYKPSDSNNYLDFDATYGSAPRGKDIKCRFSQADDIMLDSTSFLAKAKLGDETTSRNSTKKNIIQFNDEGILVESSRDLSVTKNNSKEYNALSQHDNPDLNHEDSNTNDDRMSLCNVGSPLGNCESRLECESHKTKQTVILNEDLDLIDNENNKHLPTNEHLQLKRDTSESKTYPGSTFLRYDDMDLDEGTEGRNGKTPSTGKESIYEIKHMELDGENSTNVLKDRFRLGTDSTTNNPIQLSLCFNQKNEVSKSITNNSDSHEVRECNTDNSITCALSFGNHSRNHCGNDVNSSQKHQEKNNIESEKRQWDQEIGGEKQYRYEIDCTRMANSNDVAKSHSRETIYFNQKIETESLRKQLAENAVTCSRNSQGIDKKSISMPVQRNMDLDEWFHTSIRDKDLYYKGESIIIEVENDCTHTLDTLGKTLQYNDEVVEMDLCESIRKSNEDKQAIHVCSGTEPNSKYTQQLIPTRKTLYFNDDICQMEQSKLRNFKIDCIEGCPVETTNLYSQHLYADIPSNEHDESIFKQNQISETQSKQTNTKTLGDIEPIEVYCQTIHIDNALISPPYNTVYKNKDVDNVEPANQSFASADKFCYPMPMSLIAAKLSRTRQTHCRNSLGSNHKGFIQNDICLVTPVKASVNRARLFEVTPRLSLNEFLAYEKRVESSSENDEKVNVCIGDNQYKTPARSEITSKRLPINLTPILSVAKKRHTLVFANCDMDESMPEKHDSCEIIEMKNEKCDFRDTNSQMDTSGIVSYKPVLQTPLKQRKSRIPVPLSSGKKVNKIGDINELSRSELLCEVGEHFTQSIQEMRRATTFDHIYYNFNEPKSQTGLEFQQTGQRLVFEDNPITISDVSVYFQAHRKCNTVTCDLTNTATEELKGKYFQKRYLNLTCGSEMDDIDQTRLCLVGTLSDEDADECEIEGKNAEMGNFSYEGPEINCPIKTAADNANETKKRSINQSRNVSTMCRKCKRCQETVLSETTSTITDSFVLPELPPVPFIDLERLRRFRNTSLRISDANQLWQRSSLDRTVIKLNKVSGGGNKQFSIFNEFRDEDHSVVITPIRKYQNYIQRLKVDMGSNNSHSSHSIRTSLISRLGDIFRIHSSNWVFDYQMQYMGVMTFTNKTILTFSLNLTYEEIDDLGKEIQLKSVTLEKNNIGNWKPIDFILDFQLKLNLPFDLMSLCESSNEFGIFKMLTKIDKVCMETKQMGTQLQRIVFANRAAIIRDEHRTFVRKIVRKLVPALDQHKRVEKFEFRIEVLNVKKLCFRDITMPPLFNFCEEIHLLPIGLEFLKAFLKKTISYLKENVPIRMQ